MAAPPQQFERGRIRLRPRCLSSGQTMAEYALAMPVLILLLFGMTLAGFYAFRAAAADWGVFIAGVAGGAFSTPATDQVLPSVAWDDIRNGIAVAPQTSDRQVRSQIEVRDARPWIFSIDLVEVHEGRANFRLWRFYPGPPSPGGVE
jgi:hypothetical protein